VNRRKRQRRLACDPCGGTSADAAAATAWRSQIQHGGPWVKGVDAHAGRPAEAADADAADASPAAPLVVVLLVGGLPQFSFLLLHFLSDRRCSPTHPERTLCHNLKEKAKKKWRHKFFDVGDVPREELFANVRLQRRWIAEGVRS